LRSHAIHDIKSCHTTGQGLLSIVCSMSGLVFTSRYKLTSCNAATSAVSENATAWAYT